MIKLNKTWDITLYIVVRRKVYLIAVDDTDITQMTCEAYVHFNIDQVKALNLIRKRLFFTQTKQDNKHGYDWPKATTRK